MGTVNFPVTAEMIDPIAKETEILRKFVSGVMDGEAVDLEEARSRTRAIGARFDALQAAQTHVEKALFHLAEARKVLVPLDLIAKVP